MGWKSQSQRTSRRTKAPACDPEPAREATMLLNRSGSRCIGDLFLAKTTHDKAHYG